jgi:hypothetical protein
MLWQITVEQLRALISEVPGDVVVALRVPAPGIGDPTLDVFYNLEADYNGGPVFQFVPRQVPPSAERK